MTPRRAGAIAGVVFFLCGLLVALRDGTLAVAQGADAPAYVRIARTLLATGGLELPGPGRIDDAPQQRLDDVYGSPWAMTVDGRLLPKHPWLFGAALAPGVRAAGVAGARVTALALGALLAALVTAAAARGPGAGPALAASAAVLLGSPAARNVLWAINVDTAIALAWISALLLCERGRPVAAGLLAGAVLFLRPTAVLLLLGLVPLALGRPRRERAVLLGALALPAAALAALDTAWWGAPWRTAYDRVAVLGPSGLSLAAVSGLFTLPPLEGARVLLLHPSGGLLATAPAALLAIACVGLPAARSRLAVAAVFPAATALAALAPYRFLAAAPETAYRFATPLVVAAVLPLALLLKEAERMRREG